MTRSREYAKIRRIGNGRGVLISKPVCNLLGMDIEDRFRVELEDGNLILIPVKGGR